MPFHAFADTSFIATLLFIFAIVYALLVKSKVIEIKGANVAIAGVIGFFAASFKPLSAALEGILPIAAVFLVIIFFIVLLKSLLGGGQAGDKLPLAVVLVVLLILVGVLWPGIAAKLPAGIDPNAVLTLLGVIIVIAIFAAVYYHGTGQK